MTSSELQLGPCRVDWVRREVTGPAGQFSLSTGELGLLSYLAARQGQVVTRAELLQEVWGYHADSRTRAVDNTVTRLRKKLELEPSAPRFLMSVYGVGYRLELEDLQPAPTALESLHLPERASGFVGRVAELHALDLLLQEHRLVVVVGPGGAGKTRLVLRAAARHQRHQSVIIVELAGARGAEAATRAMASAVGIVDPHPTVEARIEAMARVLDLQPTLLVLDNTEHLVAQGSQTAMRIEGLVETTSQLTVLVTSRVSTGRPTEVLFSLEGLSQADAAALFVERARPHRPSLRLHDPLVAQIVETVDRLPLAIELAASRLSLFDPEVLLARLDRGLAVLRSAEPGRHGTMRRLLQWSWDLLGDDEQLAWTQMALFARDFDLEAAEAVFDLSGDVLDALQALTDHHLLRRRGSRLSPWESVREFAQERLAEHPARTEWIRRRTRWAADAGTRWNAALRGGWDAEIYGRLRTEAQTLVLAFEEGVALDPELATQALVSVPNQLVASLGSARDRALWDLALQHLSVGPAYGEVLFRRTRSQCLSGELAQARVDVRRSIDLLADHPFLQALALAEAGVVEQRCGDQTAAARRIEQAALLFEGTGFPLRGVFTGNLGALAVAEGRFDDAEVLFQQALDQLAVGGSPMNRARFLVNLGNVYAHRGRPDLAAPYFEQARVQTEQVGDGLALIQLETSDAHRLLNLGDLQAAELASRAALVRTRATGNRPSEANVSLVLGNTLLELGRLAESETVLRHAGALYENLGARWQAIASYELGRLYLVRGDLEQAEVRLRIAAERFAGGSDRINEPLVAVHQVLLGLTQGKEVTAYVAAASARGFPDPVGDAMLAAAIAAMDGRAPDPPPQLHNHWLRVVVSLARGLVGAD